MTEKPIRFLWLQGLTCDWSKHNEHSRNIFSVRGFLSLSVSQWHAIQHFVDQHLLFQSYCCTLYQVILNDEIGHSNSTVC